VWLLGRLIERELRPARYFGLFLAGAWIGSVAELAVTGQVGIGLSGVAYGFFGFIYVNRSQHADYRRILSGGTIPLMFGWLVVCFPLTYFGVMRVANFAHLGGLAAGCVIGLASRPNAWRSRMRAAAVALGALSLGPLFWAPWHEQWLVASAYRALVHHDDDRALAQLEKIHAKNPANKWALRNEAELRIKRGDYAPARQALTKLAVDSDDGTLLNSLAWLLATCPSAEIRDGAKAVGLARRACEGDGWKNAALLDTLAAAYAEAGDFQQAEHWALKALENPGNDAPVLRQHLESFRAFKPWRER